MPLQAIKFNETKDIREIRNKLFKKNILAEFSSGMRYLSPVPHAEITDSILIATDGNSYFLSEVIAESELDGARARIQFLTKTGTKLSLAEIKKAYALRDRKTLKQLMRNAPLARALLTIDTSVGSFSPYKVPRCELLDIPVSFPWITHKEDVYEAYELYAFRDKFGKHPKSHSFYAETMVPNLALKELIHLSRANERKIENIPPAIQTKLDKNNEEVQTFLLEQKIKLEQELKNFADLQKARSEVLSRNPQLELLTTEQLKAEKLKEEAQIAEKKAEVGRRFVYFGAPMIIAIPVTLGLLLTGFVAPVAWIVAAGIISVCVMGAIYLNRYDKASNAILRSKENKIADIQKVIAYKDKLPNIAECKSLLNNVLGMMSSSTQNKKAAGQPLLATTPEPTEKTGLLSYRNNSSVLYPQMKGKERQALPDVQNENDKFFKL